MRFPLLRRRKWLCVVALPLAAGCFYPGDRGRILETRVDKLESTNARQAETQSQFTERMNAKIAEVTKVLEALDKASHRTGADVSIQLQKVVQDVALLRGQVETYLYKIEELENAVKKVGEEADRKILEFKGSDAVKAADARKKADEISRPAGKREYLALAQQRAGEDPFVGRQLYMDLLKKWPKDGEVSGEAHFGIGETYFADDKCREALFEYRKVFEEFPKTKSAPTAYLRTADCLVKLKLPDDARIALHEVIRSFPRSDAAKAAKMKIAELDKAKRAPGTKNKK